MVGCCIKMGWGVMGVKFKIEDMCLNNNLNEVIGEL